MWTEYNDYLRKYGTFSIAYSILELEDILKLLAMSIIPRIILKRGVPYIATANLCKFECPDPRLLKEVGDLTVCK
jgi:hypothetical protein